MLLDVGPVTADDPPLERSNFLLSIRCAGVQRENGGKDQ